MAGAINKSQRPLHLRARWYCSGIGIQKRCPGLEQQSATLEMLPSVLSGFRECISSQKTPSWYQHAFRKTSLIQSPTWTTVMWFPFIYWVTYYVTDTILSVLPILAHFIFTTTSKGWNNYPHFIEKEIEIHSGKVVFLKVFWKNHGFWSSKFITFDLYV